MTQEARKPHPNSPNGLWAKHGYTIERRPRALGHGLYRIIRDPEGRVVLQDAGYEGEMEWIRENLERGEVMNNAITINTRFNIDEIRQELHGSDYIRGNVHEHIMNLRDQGVREALKKLGWTPPGEESVQNQLCARIEELEKEKLELNEQLDALQIERDAAPPPPEQQSAPYVAALVDALEQIERWDGFPSTDKTWEGSGEPVSYGAAFGSNGERDFMREVARKALAAAPKPETQP